MRNILSKEEINDINDVCKEYNIEDYTINPDGSIDVDGDVYLANNRLDMLPLKFGKVSGNFDCFNNDLTSLEGCPSSVIKSFDCADNQLTSLEGCPSSVGDYIYCYVNPLLPRHFIDLYDNLSPDEFNIFFKYQDDLRIWNNGYNEEEAQILYEEIKDGML